jgi:ABC-type Fe3+-hydroxamate transport system substrate-binding protein
MRHWPLKKSTSTVCLRGKFLWKFFIAPASNYLCNMFVSSSSSILYTPARIVSLVPSITALLHALGLENETIGITKFCVHPDHWFRKKIRVGGTKNVDIHKVASLNPDFIIANKEENIKEQIEALAADYPVLLTDVNNLEEALAMIATIGKLTNKSATATTIIDSIEHGFAGLANNNKSEPVLKAAYLIWKDPYMTVGGDTFIHNMMEHAGFSNVFAQETRYPELAIDAIRQSKCDVLLLSSEPYPFKQTHLDELKHQLPGTKVWLVNGEMFSWYGSLLMEAPHYFKELMAAIKA